MKRLTSILLFAALTVSALAAHLRVASLNCYLLFDPAMVHSGQVATENPLSPDDYRAKINNLAHLAAGCDIIGLQETGGVQEVMDLATAMGYRWAFTKGRDTYTGEEVGLLYRPRPGWRYAVDGRVGELDRLVSKHLLVTVTGEGRRIRFLVVHLLRPIGNNTAKQAAQIAAINDWAKRQAQETGTTIVVLGDTNSGGRAPIFTFGQELNVLTDYRATHLTGRPFDRLAASPDGRWSQASITAPPYGQKPNGRLKHLWTDHFLLAGTLDY